VKVTAIAAQLRNPDRVNVSIDGAYRLSLDINQVVELGIKIGRELDEDELAHLEQESQFGKLYMRALEYTLLRPHSAKEVRDYLYRKTLATKYKNRKNEIKERVGASASVTNRVFDRLCEKGYIDDEKFTRFWVENRNQTKGTSRRKLTAELRAKGVESSIIEAALAQSERSEDDELHKVIAKKRRRYPDNDALIAYLARQGFRYGDIVSALAELTEDE